MRPHHAILFVLSVFVVPAAHASDASWIFNPGYYTHSPATGQRVAQYEPERPSIVPVDPTYQESGYRHQLIQVGTDWLNLVQTWGAGTAIRPYGEWEYPYRPGATPYGSWPYPQVPWIRPIYPWRNSSGMDRQPLGMDRQPFGTNREPYGMGHQSYESNRQPFGNGAAISGYGPGGMGAWQAGPQPFGVPAPMPYSGAISAPPLYGPTATGGQEL